MWGIPEVSRCRWNPFPEGWNSRCNNGLKIHKLLLYVATGSSTCSLKVFHLVVSTNPKERLCPNNGTCKCGEWSEKRSTPLFMSHDRHIDSQFLNTRWAALAIPSYLVGQNKAWLIENGKKQKNKKKNFTSKLQLKLDFIKQCESSHSHSASCFLQGLPLRKRSTVRISAVHDWQQHGEPDLEKNRASGAKLFAVNKLRYWKHCII